jgi:transcriptional regulator with XRE-family HTH domain
MAQRREERGLRWKDVAEIAGVTTETLRQIRNGGGETIRPLTRTGLEKAMLWASGSVQAVLEGRDPTPLPLPVGPLPQDAEHVAGGEASASGDPEDVITELVRTARRLADEVERLQGRGGAEPLAPPG